MKVKEPQAEEIRLLSSGQILFTYLHLAADKRLTEALLRSGATCIAYETVTDFPRGGPRSCHVPSSLPHKPPPRASPRRVSSPALVPRESDWHH
jgi:alanine dehydrogenase